MSYRDIVNSQYMFDLITLWHWLHLTKNIIYKYWMLPYVAL